MRIVSIELRRSAALGTALVLLLAGGAILYATAEWWASGWIPLAMNQRQYLVLLWPLALAAGAWQARRDQRSQVAELFASTARPRVQRAAPILTALAIAVVAGYLATAAVAVAWIVDTVDYLPPAAFVVLAVGALSLVAAVWLGLAVGRLLPSPVTAPALAVAGMGALMLIPGATRGREWLGVVLAPSQGMGLYSDFRTVSGQVSAAQGIWLAALAATAVVLLAAGSRRARAAALLPVALGATLGLLVVQHGAGYVESPLDPVARELVCAEGTPRVCVSRMHAGLLPEVTPLVRQCLTTMAERPNAPTSAAEDTTTFLDEHPQPARADTLVFRIDVGGDGHLRDKKAFVADLLNAPAAYARD
ncbi:MAG: hypothetical protein ABW000_01270 [Actinoplanes sp.]